MSKQIPEFCAYGFETKAVHAGQSPSQWTNREVIPPISLSTTYQQPTPAQPVSFEYSRSGNPSRQALETSLAALEGARFALTFSSGLATTLSIVQSLLKSGDHIVSCEDCYGGTGRLFRTACLPNGIQTTFVDSRHVAEVEKAIIPGTTKLVWIETPTNPTLILTDIEAVAEMIKRIDPDIAYVVDSTFASSYLQQPLALGADIVMHSLTKYMNGHSDVVMGAVMTNSETFYNKMKFFQNAIGTVPSPFDCFLVNRGLKTLALRMKAHCSNALQVAQMLEQHEKVVKVMYPGLKSHEQHDLAVKQMPNGFSGMVSFYVRSSDPDAASKFVSLVKIFTLAESLGGIESLCEIPSLMTHASHPEAMRKKLGIDETLVRLSVGIEVADDLIRDIRQALDQIPA